MKYIVNGSQPKKQATLRWHRLILDSAKWQTAMEAAASGSSGSAAIAAMRAKLDQALRELAADVLTKIQGRGFAPFTSQTFSGMTLEVDYPSLALPVMRVWPVDVDGKEAALTYVRVKEQMQSTKDVTVNVSLEVKQMTNDGVLLYTTPVASALQIQLLKQYYEALRLSRTLNAGEQTSYDELTTQYSALLEGALSFYAWHPTDAIYLSKWWIKTPGSVLSSAVDSTFTSSGEEIFDANSHRDITAAYTAARSAANTLGNLLADKVSKNAVLPDPDALVDLSTFTWKGIDMTKQATFTVTGYEASALVTNPGLLMGIAHEMLRDATGTYEFDATAYANTIYYFARACARLGNVEVKDARTVIGAAPASLRDYAGACWTDWMSVSDATRALAVSLLRSPPDISATENESADDSQRQTFRRYYAATANMTRDRLLSGGALASWWGSANIKFSEEVTASYRFLVMTLTHAGGTATIKFKEADRIYPASTSIDTLTAASRFVSRFMSRLRYLEAAAHSTGTATHVKVSDDNYKISVPAPLVHMLSLHTPGLSVGSDKMLSPFLG